MRFIAKLRSALRSQAEINFHAANYSCAISAEIVSQKTQKIVSAKENRGRAVNPTIFDNLLRHNVMTRVT